MTAENREKFYQPNKERLEQLAFRAIRKGLSPDEFVIVCINVDDPAWTGLANHLMPNQDWQQYRDRGEIPVARGSVLAEGLCEYLCESVPDIAPALKMKLPPGTVRAIVMDDGGASVYLIQPTPQFKEN